MPPPSEITFRLRKNPFSPFAGRDKRAGERFRRLGAAVDQDGAGRRWGALRVCSGAPGRRRSRLEFLCTVEPVSLPKPDLEEAGGGGWERWRPPLGPSKLPQRLQRTNEPGRRCRFPSRSAGPRRRIRGGPPAATAAWALLRHAQYRQPRAGRLASEPRQAECARINPIAASLQALPWRAPRPWPDWREENSGIPDPNGS